ncbi:orotidine-5'-phosphate decarboxylase [Micrococcus luteus]|uniref:orotidine-5'-phosphate decarboxylase n=1 Tax=Micrococcus luteus TaxID=1270 RepID=UPI0020053152|nr:orotidine-5'-phosphate decarboxylase [Micrococcus luteus]MCK6060666.1 orotidine-5'-phosphate decarboxylase [Micrococcus luteus]MCK6062892.1 orotidine-5'-phosphate decarboxylase [Micrococcus luteus]MCK6191606.1 orotidine-5'-phosphate decarboxylase [Micrococcus luteus]MCK6193592.1 orotidine-5'-phosphate decarboxylase [Micrococcus luteus]
MTTTATGGPGPRAPFGRRLARAMETAGPLCLGVDPHPALLRQWGLSDTPAGLEAFSLTALEAAVGPAGPRVAAIKPQVALYERHGSAGLAALERLLAAARDAGVLTIADAKRGDIGSTMDGYAAAWTSDASPLAADAVTLSPYLGFGTLVPTIRAAHEAGRGVFVLALTSNPEGREVQHVGEGSAEGSVARRIAAAAAAENAALRGDDAWGPVGLVLGATVAAEADRLGLDLPALGGPLLAPGFGAQGATAPSMRAGFGTAWPQVLATSSRGILSAGPSVASLVDTIEENRADLR